MSKEILYGAEARDALLRGVDKLERNSFWKDYSWNRRLNDRNNRWI